MQTFGLSALHLWIKYRTVRDPLVRVTLLDLYYLSHLRPKKQKSRPTAVALWSKCFFLYCKYRRALKALETCRERQDGTDTRL